MGSNFPVWENGKEEATDKTKESKVDESKTASEDIIEESKESDESISTTKSSLKRLKGVRQKPKEDKNGNLGSRVEDLLSSLKEAWK